MTANSSWPELLRVIRESGYTNPFLRGDLQTMVFRLKLQALLKDLIVHKIFGRTVAFIHVIEFQKRGLPHAHLLVTFAAADKCRTAEEIDQVISSEIPPDTPEHRRLREIVLGKMMHGPCGALNPNCPCMHDGEEDEFGSCSKKFPKEFAVATEWPQGGQVVYRRRSPQDGGEKAKRNGKGFEFNNSWVVPYNPFLLLKYNCHINVESCNSLKAIKYLFKYLFKGSDRARVKFEGDEIQYYLDCRYVGVCEAFWRLFQYEMHSSSHTIYRLQIHLPDQQLVHYKAGAEHEALERARNADTMLNAFERQREEEEGEEAVAPGLLYQELAEHYVWHKQPREWRTRERGGIRTLARMPVVTTKQLELFFLRILLQHVRGPECFEDLRTTPDGTLHPTFQEAARALGLFQDDEEYEKAMREACRLYRPKQRRQLFASILTECEPLEPANLWHKVKEHLADDYVAILRRRGHPEATLMEAACNWALYDIKIRVESRNCYLQSINMPMPSEPSLADIAQHFATVGERTFDRNVEAEKLARDLHKLNTTQREIFDRVKQSLETQQQALLFVEGAGGTGKTFMFRLLCNLVRSRGETVLPCAYSGIAAKNYEGGSTFHFQAKSFCDSQSIAHIPH